MPFGPHFVTLTSPKSSPKTASVGHNTMRDGWAARGARRTAARDGPYMIAESLLRPHTYHCALPAFQCVPRCACDTVNMLPDDNESVVGANSTDLASFLVERALACAVSALQADRADEALRHATEALNSELALSSRSQVLARAWLTRGAAHAASAAFELALRDARDSLRAQPSSEARTHVSGEHSVCDCSCPRLPVGTGLPVAWRDAPRSPACDGGSGGLPGGVAA